MERNVKNLEDFFWKFLLINPILDILNGFYIHYLTTVFGNVYEDSGLAVTPTLAFRMGVLVLFAVYLLRLRDRKAVLTVLPMGAAWVLSVVSELVIGQPMSIFTDVQYFAKFLYNIAVVLAYTQLFHRCGLGREALLKKLNKIITVTLILLSLAILIPYAFGAGLTTYADRFGYRGARGYFYSGNDITAIFMLLLPIACTYFMNMQEKDIPRKKKLFYAIAPAFTCICLCLIGTKTAFISVGVTVIALVLYSLLEYIRKKNRVYLRRILLIIVVTLLVLVVLSLINQSLLADISESFGTASEVAERDGLETAILSGRQEKFGNAFSQFQENRPISYLFGIGRGSQEFVVEMDVFEVLFYYGVFGAIAMLWMYVKLGVGFFLKFWKNINIRTLGVLLSLVLCAGYLFIAGHVLFSVTSGFYFALMLVYSTLILKKSE